ncbi:response regulator receiver protein [Fulvivirga imtechensis AK7]|uniref:Response regulator receiver protein n=2 Tax=Fulvivirga TaxID=396811 RepID=L8JY22_9BACT|nr:response regulator receiver protein [Fulvivirga imtechensis AK7]
MVTCLLVDDDPDDHEIFEIALHDLDEGHSCHVVSTGLDAISLLEEERSFTPEFIFIDVNMPYISGFDCLRQVKKIQRLDTVPVIMYSTSAAQKDISEARHLGASHYFVKPIRMSLLSETLARLLHKESLPFVIP